MSIQYVAGSAVNQQTNNANPSFAVDVGTGTDRLLVVVALDRTTSSLTITGATYGGQTVTEIDSIRHSTANLTAHILYLVNPPSGSNTLSLTYSSTTSVQFSTHAAAFIGVDQTSPLDDFDKAEGSSNTPSVTTTPTTDNQLVVGGLLHESATPFSPSGETSLVDADHGAWVTSSSYIIQTTAAAQAVDWTGGSSDTWVAIAATFKEAADTNTSPTTVLNTADSTTFTTATPTVQFTGTDADGDDIRYNVQITDSIDFISGSNIRDNYHGGGGGNFHPQPAATLSWENEYQVDDRPGMSFAGSGGILEAISSNGLTGDSPASGVAFLRVYNAIGPAGSRIIENAADASATPTPNWLAQSEHASIIGAQTASFFNFTGTNRIWLHSGSQYIFVYQWNATTPDPDNTYSLQGDGSILQAPGNFYNDGWSVTNNGSRSIYELFFDIYETNVLLDKVSGTDSGFANPGSAGDTDPFISACAINFTVQSGDALTNQREYRWRARGIDPNGTNIYGDWATSRFFFINIASGGSVYDESVSILSLRNFSPLSNAIFDESTFLNKASYVFDGNNIDGISLLEVRRVESVIVSDVITASAEQSINKIVNILQSENVDAAGDLSFDKIVNVLQSENADAAGNLSLLATRGYGVLANLVAGNSFSIPKIDNISTELNANIGGDLSISRNENIFLLPGLVLSDDLALNRIENILEQGGLNVLDDLAILKNGNISVDMILEAAESVAIERGDSISIQDIIDAINSLSVDKKANLSLDNDANINSSLSISSITDILLSGGFSVVDSIEIGKIDGIEQNSVYTILGEIAAGRTVNVSSSTILVAESAIIVDSSRNIFLQNVADINSTVFLGSLLAITQLSESSGGGGVVILYNPIGQSGVVGSIIIRGARNGSR